MAGRLDLFELEACRPGGDAFFAEISGRRIAFQDHDAVALGVLDVSERKRAEEEIARQRQALAQSEKLNAMGALLASVSHELNNPLSIIVGQSRLLQEVSGDRSTIDHAERIVRAAERCSRIVKTFLGMARQRPPQREPIDANALIRSAVDLVDYPLRTAGIDLSLSLDDDGPVVSADQDQLIQVIVNMLINAQQALVEQPPPRTVRISTARDAGNLIIDVEDNGPGIADNLFDTVFEPYFTTKPEGFGTGVGLAVTRNIVAFHEGTITAGQSQLGGALFRALLPLSGTAAETKSETNRPDTIPALRILVVDDEADITATLQGDLGAEGHLISKAADGVEALHLLREHSFDVVLSDIRMPRMDGRELYRKIVELELFDPRRIGFMTGDTLNASVREFLDRTDAPVIEKPIHPGDLRQLLADLVQDDSSGSS